MKYLFTYCLLIVTCAEANSQKRKLAPMLNNQSFNYTAPFISLDGSIIFFMYDYTDDNTIQPYISLRDGVDWKEPAPIPRKITALSFRKGYTFSPDGKIMYVTSRTRSGFDILSSQISGTTFTEPYTIGPPINSTENDATPTFSPDGNLMVFMRCKKMDFNSADECRILISKKRNGLWQTPTELPPSINKGNSQMPRILGDGQSLVFSSNKHTPNSGGMDLYMTKLDEATWSEPIHLEFANSAADDVYSSATSLGMTLIKDSKGDKKWELVEYTFPRELKPKSVARIVGQVSGLTDLTKAYVTAVNLETKQIVSRTTPDKSGNYFLYISEGIVYGIYVDPPTDQFRYVGKRYDFREGSKVPSMDRMAANLLPVKSGDVIDVTGVSFKPYTSEIDPTSIIDIQKISKMIKGNPSMKFNLDVTLQGLEKDSTQSDELTEVIADTVVYQKEVQIDSATTQTIDSIAVEYTFHNDRTERQVEVLSNFILKQGVKEEQITLSHKAIEEPIADKRRTIIYLRVK